MIMREYGIPGIKYLDQGSRGRTTWEAIHPRGGVNEFPTQKMAEDYVKRNPEYRLVPPKQTRNFVKFSDENIKMLEINGKPVPQEVLDTVHHPLIKPLADIQVESLPAKGTLSDFETAFSGKLDDATRGEWNDFMADFDPRGMTGESTFTRDEFIGILKQFNDEARGRLAGPSKAIGPARVPGDIQFPRAADMVDGRIVRKDVPNTSSISASLDNYEVVPGIREVDVIPGKPQFYSASEQKRTLELAEQIKASKEISPLIIVIRPDGSDYILEGAHRYDALRILGAKSFPALVVKELP